MFDLLNKLNTKLDEKFNFKIRGRSRERSSELHYSGRSREESQSPERGRDRSTDRRGRERMDWQDCRDERGQRLKPTSSKESPFDPHEEQSMFR